MAASPSSRVFLHLALSDTGTILTQSRSVLLYSMRAKAILFYFFYIILSERWSLLFSPVLFQNFSLTFCSILFILFCSAGSDSDGASMPPAAAPKESKGKLRLREALNKIDSDTDEEGGVSGLMDKYKGKQRKWYTLPSLRPLLTSPRFK